MYFSTLVNKEIASFDIFQKNNLFDSYRSFSFFFVIKRLYFILYSLIFWLFIMVYLLPNLKYHL